MKLLISLPLLLLLLHSCTPAPQDINYGMDGCQFCKMKIVDPRYGAELVSTTGKVYKFDAIECMINYKKEFADKAYALQLVNTHDHPKKLFAVDSCSFLISQNMPSPMGAFLTGFSNKQEALKMQKIKGGTVYHWEKLIAGMEEEIDTLAF